MTEAASLLSGRGHSRDACCRKHCGGPNFRAMSRRVSTSQAFACLAILVCGCGSADGDSALQATGGSAGESSPKGTGGTGAGAAGSGGAEGLDPGSEWKTLLTGDWTLAAGTEDYVCVRHTIKEDIYIKAFEGINPLGTHHTFLTMGPPSGPDGVTQCEATENHGKSIFGSGVGTNPIEYPEGVAIKVEAGSQMLLNLHLFNATADELSGTSGTKMLPIDESEVEFIGQSLTAGAFDLSLPPHQESSVSGSCTVSSNTTVFAVQPHMHQLGKHMKVVAESSVDGEQVLHDAPYDFEQQLYYPVAPLQLSAGDSVQFECTWENTTDRTVGFGDSSLDEMCFVALYRFPAEGSDFCNPSPSL